ncbi:MAG TPA: hypothetical protein PLS90_10935 [Candidatus Sumerlaeota bacterium]|nr:hypothetical protein [Candidatus Sumerlaeota bacterium]HOR26395.1 hypothetical protein [Candidatus Sumerlaeota bacterium]HPK02959.1 hypothetical protein [Candidatus Sumerlaeota bacterium]
MFRLWILATIVAVTLATTLHSVRTAGRGPGAAAPLPSRLRRLGRVCYLLVLAGVGLAGLTGVVGAGLRGVPMEGYGLLLHVAAGGVFAPALAALAVLWADRNRFGSPQPFSLGQKICFWMMLACGLVMILTGIGPMFRLFGTEAQRAVIAIHRHAALALLATAIFHIYLSVRYRGV